MTLPIQQCGSQAHLQSVVPAHAWFAGASCLFHHELYAVQSQLNSYVTSAKEDTVLLPVEGPIHRCVRLIMKPLEFMILTKVPAKGLREHIHNLYEQNRKLSYATKWIMFTRTESNHRWRPHRYGKWPTSHFPGHELAANVHCVVCFGFEPRQDRTVLSFYSDTWVVYDRDDSLERMRGQQVCARIVSHSAPPSAVPFVPKKVYEKTPE